MLESDIRTLPGMSREQLEADIERFLAAVRRDHPALRIELEFEAPPLGWIPATEVPAAHAFVGALLNASAQVLGRRPALSAFPGGTDAAKFQALAGIPTIPSFALAGSVLRTARTNVWESRRSCKPPRFMPWPHKPT